jgi:hypothetical protein
MNLKSKVKLTARAISNSLSSEDQGVEATDILDTLKREHDEVKDLLKKLSDAETAAQRRTLVLKIKASLVPHTKAEEKVVYDAVIALRDKGAQMDGTKAISSMSWQPKHSSGSNR